MKDHADKIIDELIKRGFLIEHPDGTIEATPEGLDLAEQFKAMKEAEGMKQ